MNADYCALVSGGANEMRRTGRNDQNIALFRLDCLSSNLKLGVSAPDNLHFVVVVCVKAGS